MTPPGRRPTTATNRTTTTTPWARAPRARAPKATTPTPSDRTGLASLPRLVRRRGILLCLPLALLLQGCGEEDQRTGEFTRQRIGQARAGLTPETAAHLDSGNAAYREGDYRAALSHYRTATELQEDAAAAWFGIHMAYRALGREDSARAALERAGSLSESGGTLHPAPTSSPHDTGGGGGSGEDRDGG